MPRTDALAHSRARKVVLVIATVMLVGGCLLSLGSFAAAGFDWKNLSTTRDWVQESRTLAPEAEAPHTALVVSESFQSVYFEPAAGDAFEVEYWNSNTRTVEITEEGGVLTVQSSEKPQIMMFDFPPFQRGATVVKVPRSFTGTLSVETGDGNVDAQELTGLGDVSVRTEGGGVDLKKVSSSGMLSVHTERGGVNAQEVEAAGNMELASSTGRVLAYTAKAADFAASSTGYVQLALVEAAQVIASSAHDCLNADRVTAGSIALRTGSQNISAGLLVSDDISIDTTSGRVTATVVGTEDDYAVIASSERGAVDAPQGTDGAAKRIAIRTTSGPIGLSFVDENGFNQGTPPYPEPQRSTRGVPEAPAAPAGPAPPAAPAAPGTPATPAESEPAA